MALKDRLENLRQDAERDNQWQADRPKLIAEWQQAVKWLFARVREWLAGYEQSGLLTFSEQEIPLTEEAIGPYRIGVMELRAGKATIVLRPVGRIIIGATGRVDMHLLGRMIENERIMLLRSTQSGDPDEKWTIALPVIRGREGVTVQKPFTQQGLEEAVERLLA
jgi:hypothetical protein